MAAAHAMQYNSSLRMNCSLFWDPSHDAWRSVLETTKVCGLYGFVILCMVCINLPHGPDGSDLRFNQLLSASRQLFEVHRPESMPLFQQYAHHMLDSLAGELEGADGPKEVVLWNWLKTHSIFRKSFIRDSDIFLKYWWANLFVAEFCAVELDMLKSKSLAVKLPLNKSGADVAADVGATRALQADERALRSASQNAVVVTVLTLSDMRHYRLLQVIVNAARPVSEWHSAQNIETRDTERTRMWLIDQCSGGFMKHAHQVLTHPSLEPVAQACGFGTPGGERSSATLSQGEISYEDELAATFGLFSTALACARMKRVIPILVGYPWSLTAALQEGTNVAGTIQGFKQAWEDYSRLCAVPDPTIAMKRVRDRSPFKQLAVEQVRIVLEQDGWQLTVRVRALIEGRCR